MFVIQEQGWGGGGEAEIGRSLGLEGEVSGVPVLKTQGRAGDGSAVAEK